MAASIPIKEQLAQLLNNLEEMNSLLKNNLNDFDQQVKQATLEWLDNPSEANIDFKEVVSIVTTVNTALLKLKQTISVSCTKYQAMAAGDKTTQENKSVDSVHDGNYSDLPMSVAGDLNNKLEQRVERLETALTSMQSRNKRTEADVTEIKQWRDTYKTEESNINEQIEQLAIKQKHNAKQFRKQINEQKHITDEMNEEMKQLNEIKQWRKTLISEHNTMAKKLEELSKTLTDNKEKTREQIQESKTRINELNTEIKTLKQKESNTSQTLEITNTEINKFDIMLNKVNEELKIQTTNTEILQKEIKRHSDILSHLREEGKKNKNTETKVEKLMSMHSVMSKILQQRLMPFESLIQKFNQNLASRQINKQKLATLENDNWKLSNDLDSIKIRVCQPYICQLHLDNNTTVTTGSILSTFYCVWESYGNHFNRTTGKLVAPDDGYYLVIVTLRERDAKLIKVDVYRDDSFYQNCFVKSANTSAAGATAIYMMKGQELYFKVGQADDGAKLQGGSGFTILRL
ncbi:putative leucine-rich repeat-containing protein DDB_G0290503 [Physella acuta]|uniref:putative leucine-rich repeat-containing protein DDB_G0290503 n=1 Tax=Physella acuta TaxID=109671 RepID=UPI0027DCB5AB|nr:putative leucine-rich repeat-containing protein DDB_G0290503 [Physella acuta]